MVAGMLFFEPFDIEAAPVIFNFHHKILPVVEADIHFGGLGVFADIGEAFLQYKHDLQLLLAVELGAVAMLMQVHADLGLALEAVG